MDQQDKAVYFHERYALGHGECGKMGLKLIISTMHHPSLTRRNRELTYEVLMNLCLPVQPTRIFSNIDVSSPSLRD